MYCYLKVPGLIPFIQDKNVGPKIDFFKGRFGFLGSQRFQKYMYHFCLNGFRRSLWGTKLLILTVVEPIKKAAMSVTDVTVIDTPACLMAFAIGIVKL